MLPNSLDQALSDSNLQALSSAEKLRMKSYEKGKSFLFTFERLSAAQQRQRKLSAWLNFCSISCRTVGAVLMATAAAVAVAAAACCMLCCNVSGAQRKPPAACPVPFPISFSQQGQVSMLLTNAGHWRH